MKMFTILIMIMAVLLFNACHSDDSNNKTPMSQNSSSQSATQVPQPEISDSTLQPPKAPSL